MESGEWGVGDGERGWGMGYWGDGNGVGSGAPAEGIQKFTTFDSIGTYITGIMPGTGNARLALRHPVNGRIGSS
jgi:hypothetical protein